MERMLPEIGKLFPKTDLDIVVSETLSQGQKSRSLAPMENISFMMLVLLELQQTLCFHSECTLANG